jgi:type IV pilus assembly protein PilE
MSQVCKTVPGAVRTIACRINKPSTMKARSFTKRIALRPTTHAAPRTGFTLIELMITIAIVAILATVAYPSYVDYVIRSRLAEVGNTLPSLRAQMEQYHQDFRRYTVTAGSDACGVTPPTVNGFVLACTATDQTFRWTMTANAGGQAPASYSVDHLNNRVTIAWPTRWGGNNVPAQGATEWLLKR